MLSIDLAGERLTLWPHRALSWRRQRMLLIADLHLGKPATFRASGIPAPESTTDADLARIDHLVECSQAECIMILGDFLHARAGRAPETMNAVGEWAERIANHGIRCILIRGNHDLNAGDPPPQWKIESIDGPFVTGPFSLQHEPMECPHGHYTLAGHLHPAAILDCPTGAAMRAPCFWFGQRIGVLPAFGSFTGARAVRPVATDRVFVIGDGKVIEASAPPRDRPPIERSLRHSRVAIDSGPPESAGADRFPDPARSV